VSRAHATPATTLMVGDSPVDLATARRAGTLICLARYGFGFRFEGDGFRGDEYFVDTPSDLRGVVNRASRGNGDNRGNGET
jgi:phosphoglycolate phosphatase-like HAD superfamily hydrolase